MITGTPNTVYPQMAFTGAATTTTLLTNVKQVMDGARRDPARLQVLPLQARRCPIGDLELLTAAGRRGQPRRASP